MQNIIFYSYLDLYRLFFLCLRLKNYQEIFYFTISKQAEFFIWLLKLREKIKRFEYLLSEMRHRTNTNYSMRIEPCQLMFTDIITDRYIKKSCFIRAFGNMFDSEKIVHYFRRIASEEIKENVVYVNVIEWYFGKLAEKHVGSIVFCTQKSVFFDNLRDILKKEFCIDLIPYFSIRKVFQNFYHFLLSFARLFGNAILITGKNTSLFLRNKRKQKPVARAALGVGDVFFGITFDLTERCGFPWLLFADIPYEQILLYFKRVDVPIADDKVFLLRKHKINFLALTKSKLFSDMIPIFIPSLKTAKMLFIYAIKLVLLSIQEILNFRFSFFNFFKHVVIFVLIYCKYYDLYRLYNIKVAVDREDGVPTRVAEQLALQKLGGISASYQLCNWPISSPVYGSCSDIMFLFGPYYLPFYIESGTCSRNILFTGYISDYSIGSVKAQSRALRNRLMANGAKFIISYFDENENAIKENDKLHLEVTKNASYTYKRLLNWVLCDETIGLICSPKRPTTLLKRVPDIESLLNKAKDTGRCVFMEGEYRTKSYPTEPAQASNLAITVLGGGTVTLECYLSGVRTVYLDLEKLYSFPEYKWGKNSIVFDDVDVLIDAINNYRNNEESFKELGNKDIIPVLKQKDPFQDGKAAKRMGQYLYWLLEKIDAGLQKDEVVKYANQRYIETWGKENLVKINN